jgi:Protein of unknown function (DUF1592)/Protein of unknown function (DUF1588)/Protein of unknown function (DUF1587)/Protein of unknown function (DUF1595)/Protein of unknown function (DUF1585)
MTLFHVSLLFAASALLLLAQQVSFSGKVYPVLEQAGCRNCHNVEGVASATRLHFPAEDAAKPRVEAFGKSLIEFVDRQNPGNSILLLKPTLRIPHTGGERIAKGSPEEAALKSWIGHLATLSGADLAEALRYRQDEAGGYGVTPTVVLRRLTHSQYNNTVRDLLKDTSNPASQFPTEDFVNGFKNQYQALSVSPILTEAYSRAAERLAANAFRRGDSRGLLPCKPASDGDADCKTKFIQTFGRRAFRRPLEAEEIAWYQAIFKIEKNFLAGAQAVIETMLQSPSFVFWLEETPNPKWKPYAKASRLAYFIWDAAPDDTLLDSAARGDLNTPEGIERVARRMLDDPRAKDGLDEFVSEWMRFDRVMTASRERRIYPLFSHELAKSMTEECRRFISDLVWNDRNFMDAFTAKFSFINSDLAAVYKTPPPARDFDRVEFPPEAERAGLLGQALFLTLSSKPDETAPTGRGLFIREQFLCQQVPPPPPGVDTNLPPIEESKPVTNRERLAMHANNQMCAGCHKLIDPIGFGFEKFDAIGMRREKQKLLFYPNLTGVAARRAKPKVLELELDTKGRVAGIQDSEFSSPRELGELLAKTPQCQECVVKQVFRYMSGRQDTPADRPVLNQALNAFRKSDYRFKELMIALVKLREYPDSGRRTTNVANNH